MLSNYPPGLRPLQDTGPEDPCPKCNTQMLAMHFWRNKQKQEKTNSLECPKCGLTLTLEEYEHIVQNFERGIAFEG